MTIDVIKKAMAYLSDYMSFDDSRVPLALVLWALATHIYESFDAFPYLVITAATKQAGKTRLSELLGFLSGNAKPSASIKPGALYQIIEDFKPTLIIDEAETFSTGDAGDMRSILNAGYRKGQTVMRRQGLQVMEYKVYCPKVFVLIGDVYDTLRDRSIVITLRRGEPRKRFLYDAVKAEGQALGAEFSELLKIARARIETQYASEFAEFLTDRDEEIWRPLFSLCRILAPEFMRELTRLSADLCADKTQERKRFVNLSNVEDKAQGDQYAKRALADILQVLNGDSFLPSTEAVERMKALDVAPWRRYQGAGLTPRSLANLLTRFGLHPRAGRKAGNVKASGPGQGTAKGYYRADVEKAVKQG